ncbi:hypothetical protein Vafri_15432, partial [Volvox africanus]
LAGGRAATAAEALMPPPPPPPPPVSEDADAEASMETSAAAAATTGGGGVLGEGGYLYGFEHELQLVDLAGLTAAAAPPPSHHVSPPTSTPGCPAGSVIGHGNLYCRGGESAAGWLRDLALRCLSRLGLTPLQPADVIARHVLPALRHMHHHHHHHHHQVDHRARDRDDDPWVSEDSSSNHSPGRFVQNRHQQRTIAPAGPRPGVLVGYAAYLMHHQHLAARDPRVARQWADALLWVLVPPPQPPALTLPPSGLPQHEQSAHGVPVRGGKEPTRQGEKEASRAGGGGGGGSSPDLDEDWSPGSMWAAVPSREGISLGLSFQESFVARHPSSTAAAAMAALAEARRDVPCALWAEAYLRFGSAARWAEFCGPSVLDCGFTFVRLAEGGYGDADPRVSGGKVSTDLEALLSYLGVPPSSPPLPLPTCGGDPWDTDPSFSDTANPSVVTAKVNVTAVAAANLPGLHAVACLLDAVWSAEYDTHAWVVSSTVAPTDPQIRQQQWRRPAPFLELLQNRAWLPDSWGGCAAPSGGEVLPASCRPLRTLLGPTARYVGVELTDPRFIAALGLPTAPSLRCVLTQLRLWSRHDTSVSASASANASAAAVAASVSGPQSPSFITLAGCYSYLSGLVAAEAASISGVAAAVTRPQNSEQEERRERSDIQANGGRKDADGERAISVVRTAFVHEPLIAVRKAADIDNSPTSSPLLPSAGVVHAAGGGGGGRGTGTGALRWCHVDEVVWSLGPLTELVSEYGQPLFGGDAAAASSSPAAAAAAAASLLPSRLAETYPASLEHFFVGLLAVRHHPGPQHLLTALREMVSAAEAAAATPSSADGLTPVQTAGGGRREGGAALMCLGWLGCLMGQQQDEETGWPSGVGGGVGGVGVGGVGGGG